VHLTGDRAASGGMQALDQRTISGKTISFSVKAFVEGRRSGPLAGM